VVVRVSTVLLLWFVAAALAGTEPEDRGTEPAAAAPDRTIRADVEWAISRAIRKLEKPDCRLVFADFVDSEGRTLQQNLDLRGETGPDLLRGLRFRDGTGERPCSYDRVAAFTTPGSPAISICGPEFRRALRDHPARAANLLLHEALHRLGLEESSRLEDVSAHRPPGRLRPPTSLEITDRVAARCGS
jgi:hypothetical protein